MGTLEDVFLQLCRRQDAVSSPVESINSPIDDLTSDEETPLLTRERGRRGKGSRASEDGSLSEVSVQRTGCCGNGSRVIEAYATQACRSISSAFSCQLAHCCPQPANILALCWKNAAKIYRNPWLVIFQFLMPTLQVSLLCLTIGRNLHGVNLAYFNNDRGGSVDGCKGHSYLNGTGEWFIDILAKDNTFTLHGHSSEESAVQEVRDGRTWAAVVIGENFTVDLFQRISNYNDKSVAEGSTIYIYADVTNSQILAVIENNTAFAFELYAERLVNFCNRSSAALSPPVKVHQPPVYGRTGLSFTDYMGPGVIASTALGISIGLTAVVLIQERKEGLMDRTWVAGVSVAEIIISQVVTQFFILLVQIILMLVFVLWVFQVYNRSAGNIPLLMVLALLQGMTGMSFGLVISAICGDENTALQVSIATFYPVLVLSGVLWPLEGMPTVLRYLGSALPMTYPAQAMRAAMGRGWGLEYEEVWRGFVLGITWFIVFLFIAGIGLRIRK
jgi:ABC-type multidrug transport system permease subunit